MFSSVFIYKCLYLACLTSRALSVSVPCPCRTFPTSTCCQPRIRATPAPCVASAPLCVSVVCCVYGRPSDPRNRTCTYILVHTRTYILAYTTTGQRTCSTAARTHSYAACVPTLSAFVKLPTRLCPPCQPLSRCQPACAHLVSLCQAANPPSNSLSSTFSLPSTWSASYIFVPSHVALSAVVLPYVSFWCVVSRTSCVLRCESRNIVCCGWRRIH